MDSQSKEKMKKRTEEINEEHPSKKRNENEIKNKNKPRLDGFNLVDQNNNVDTECNTSTQNENNLAESQLKKRN